MNKYIVPICDIEAGSIWNKIILAKSIPDCKDKLMDELIEYYDFDNMDNYSEFVSYLDDQNILIGDIKDVDEL